MTFYWYDRNSKPQDNGNGAPDRRPGDGIPGFKDLVAQFKASYIALAHDFGQKSSPCLAFVHTGDQTDNTMHDWLNVSNGQGKRYVIFLSSASIADRNINSKTIYCLNRSITEFLSDTVRVDEFKKSCEKGEPDWGILAPLRNSYLIALAILCQGYLAAHKGTDLYNKLPEKIRDKVKEKANTTEQLSWWEIITKSDDINKEIEALSEDEEGTKTKIHQLVSDLQKHTKEKKSIAKEDLSSLVRNADEAFCALAKSGRCL